MMPKALMVLLGALSGYLLFGAAGALGAAAVLVNLLTPLPAAVLGMRFGSAWGATVVILTMTAVLVTSGVTSALFYMAQFGLPSLLLPWLLGRGMPWDRAVVATLAMMLTFGVLVLLGITSGAGQSPVGFVTEQIDKEIDQAITMMQEFAGTEQTPEAAEAFREMTAGMSALMHQAYPAMLVVVCAALQLITVAVLAFVVRPVPLPGTPFARWRSPELLVWVLIVAGFGVVFATGALQSVAINVLIVLLPVYFLQGLAVVESFLARKGLAPALRALTYLFLLVINPLPMIVTGLGVFALWADFRKPRIRAND